RARNLHMSVFSDFIEFMQRYADLHPTKFGFAVIGWCILAWILWGDAKSFADRALDRWRNRRAGRRDRAFRRDAACATQGSHELVEVIAGRAERTHQPFAAGYDLYSPSQD